MEGRFVRSSLATASVSGGFWWLSYLEVAPTLPSHTSLRQVISSGWEASGTAQPRVGTWGQADTPHDGRDWTHLQQRSHPSTPRCTTGASRDANETRRG